MRIRDEKLKAELVKARNEFAAYTAKTQREHQKTQEEVVRIYRQRKVDGREWGKDMAQAKERDELLTKKIAEMEEKLRKAGIVPTETAGTHIGKVLWRKDYISYHPKEVAEMGEDQLDPRMSLGHPTQETITLMTIVTIGPQIGQVMILGNQRLVRTKHRIQQKQKEYLKY